MPLIARIKNKVHRFSLILFILQSQKVHKSFDLYNRRVGRRNVLQITECTLLLIEIRT